LSKYNSKVSVILLDCIFCKIVQGEIPSQKVYENEQIIIINDVQPIAPVHWLVIPKYHISNICDPKVVADKLPEAIFQTIQEATMNSGLFKDGFRVVVNYGQDAGLTVPHLHFHIIGGRKLAWPPG